MCESMLIKSLSEDDLDDSLAADIEALRQFIKLTQHFFGKIQVGFADTSNSTWLAYPRIPHVEVRVDDFLPGVDFLFNPFDGGPSFPVHISLFPWQSISNR